MYARPFIYIEFKDGYTFSHVEPLKNLGFLLWDALKIHLRSSVDHPFVVDAKVPATRERNFWKSFLLGTNRPLALGNRNFCSSMKELFERVTVTLEKSIPCLSVSLIKPYSSIFHSQLENTRKHSLSKIFLYSCHPFRSLGSFSNSMLNWQLPNENKS